MEITDIPFCKLKLTEKFAIINVNDGIIFNLEKAAIIRNHLKAFYKKDKFVLISLRENTYVIDERILFEDVIENMQGWCIVSKNPYDKKKAIKEQSLFPKPYAFFTDLEDAQDWANTF